MLHTSEGRGTGGGSNIAGLTVPSDRGDTNVAEEGMRLGDGKTSRSRALASSVMSGFGTFGIRLGLC